MIYAQRDILLFSMVFSDASGVKKRPVMVVYDNGDDDLLVAPVTSQPARTHYDMRLDEWQKAGLRLPSILRLEKLATVAKSTVLRRLGRVSSSDWQRLQPRLEELFATIVGQA